MRNVNEMRTIRLGDVDEFAKTISESDVYLFSGITGDMNPMHVNAEYAAQTKFGRRIAHGLLVAGMLGNVLGNRLPGVGTVYVSQELRFLAPTFIGDTVTARVEVVEVTDSPKRVKLKTTCTNQDGVVVVDGFAVVSPPRTPPASS